MDLRIDRTDSALGPITLIAAASSLVALEFGSGSRLAAPLARRYGRVRLVPAPDPLGACSRLRAYLAGDLRALEDLPVDPGGTPFQRRVWQILRTIPPGTTVSYGELAARLGRPAAARAVGAANARNPIAIAIPCHRVIGTDAHLRGYGGGLARKRWLLRHEGALPR